MPLWTVAMDGVQLQYFVLTSEYKAQFFPSCLKCFAFMFFLVLISVYASAVQYLWVGKSPNLAPILLDQFGTSSTRLRLLFELLDPSLRSLHLLDGSAQYPFGTIPPLADPAENREQADDGQQVNCNHFLHLLSNLFCSLRTSTQSSCRIHSGRDNRVS